jgi:septal ring factor EnvC (AmiA/AmiB activator)
MKKLLTILTIVIFAAQTGAQTTDYLQQKDFQLEKKKIYEGINNSRKQLNEIKKEDLKIANSIDSIKLSLEMKAVQLSSDIDSLAKTNARLNTLKDRFDNQKLPSSGFLILLFVILLLLFVIILVMIFLFKKRADTNHQSIVDLDKLTNERIDVEVKNLKSDIQSIREALHAFSAELGHKISSGYVHLDTQCQQLETLMKEGDAGIEVKLSTFLTETSKHREEHSRFAKELEDKLHILKRETDLLNQALTVRAAKLEEELRLLQGK